MIGHSILRKNGGKNSKPKEKTDTFHLSCRKAGLRITPQRMAIYKALLELGEHPSAEMVFRKVREVFSRHITGYGEQDVADFK